MLVVSMKKILARAISDTFSGKMRAAILAIAATIISISLLYYWKGKNVALEELSFSFVGAAGAFGALVLLFLWNLIMAPYRIMDEKVSLLEAQREELLSKELARSVSSPLGRLKTLLNSIDGRIVTRSGVQEVRMEPRDFYMLNGLIAEQGDFSPVNIISTGRVLRDSLVMDGMLGKTQADELVEIKINITGTFND